MPQPLVVGVPAIQPIGVLPEEMQSVALKVITQQKNPASAKVPGEVNRLVAAVSAIGDVARGLGQARIVCRTLDDIETKFLGSQAVLVARIGLRNGYPALAFEVPPNLVAVMQPPFAITGVQVIRPRC